MCEGSKIWYRSRMGDIPRVCVRRLEQDTKDIDTVAHFIHDCLADGDEATAARVHMKEMFKRHTRYCARYGTAGKNEKIQKFNRVQTRSNF